MSPDESKTIFGKSASHTFTLFGGKLCALFCTKRGVGLHPKVPFIWTIIGKLSLERSSDELVQGISSVGENMIFFFKKN